MARRKLKQINAVKSLENVINEAENFRGKWHEFFNNKNPIVLELACGKGQYTLALAEKFPEKNFIGIDKKGDRIWKAANKGLSQSIPNATFIRMSIEDILNYFAPEDVSEIWITFPDPFPKPSKANKRLTAKIFLDKYAQVIKKNAPIHLKTDNDKLFDFTINTIKELNLKIEQIERDVHNMNPIPEELVIKTYYEEKFSQLGSTIKYVKFKLN